MAMFEGAYLRDKTTCARTSIENVGGAYTRRGAYIYLGRYGTICAMLIPLGVVVMTTV